MASEVAIANMALSHVGSDAVMASLDDLSIEAGRCRQFFAMARTEMLEAGSWSFAKARVALAEATENPSPVWTYAYRLPSDVLSPLRVLSTSALQTFTTWPFASTVSSDELRAWNERGGADFEIEGEYATGNALLLTHEPDAVLLYVRDVSDTSKYSATATSALSYLLASYIAGPILRGLEGARAAQTLRKVAYDMIGRAAVQDANSSLERNVFTPEALQGR